MSEYHEPENELSPLDRDFHRALASLREELEAVDWYHQRVVASKNPELKKIMAHNRDEEIEHACMALEWLRRNMPMFDQHMRTYLFTEVPITEIEEQATGAEGSGINEQGLGIGSLKSSPVPNNNTSDERR
jgi:ferritin-like protein